MPPAPPSCCSKDARLRDLQAQWRRAYGAEGMACGFMDFAMPSPQFQIDKCAGAVAALAAAGRGSRATGRASHPPSPPRSPWLQVAGNHRRRAGRPHEHREPAAARQAADARVAAALWRVVCRAHRRALPARCPQCPPHSHAPLLLRAQLGLTDPACPATCAHSPLNLLSSPPPPPAAQPGAPTRCLQFTATQCCCAPAHSTAAC